MKSETPVHKVPPGGYPMVSILVPAHNEGLVIERTVRSLLSFDYPADRYEIVVINDNSSDDSSARLSALQKEFPDRGLTVINTDAVTGGKGKSNALNIGLQKASGTVLAIYDADNTPEKGALRILTEELMADDHLGAVIGKFRTRNRNATILTRFVNIETLAYQCMNQAGRWFFFKLCTIPGTNYVVRRSIIEKIGGWDTKALSEDTEVSFRIYRMGYFIKQMPSAVTWEQEPHLLSVWFHQRTRWAKGNLYVVFKNIKYIFDIHAGRMRLDVLYYTVIYLIMLSSLLISDAIFVLGILGFVHITLGGFSTTLWILAIITFEAEMMMTLATEKNEFTLGNAGLVLLMLFTYSKLWAVVVLNSIWQSIRDAAGHREVKWDKTVRYVEKAADENAELDTMADRRHIRKE